MQSVVARNLVRCQHHARHLLTSSYHHHCRSSVATMKFPIVSLLALSVPASAWAPASAARPAFASMASALFSTSTEVVGEEATESFRLKFKTEDGEISPWHDIPLKGAGDSYNMVVEIPKMTKAKMEVATKEENNPIAQDIKKGNLRDYHGPIFWNYGCLPQTWEDPNVEHPELKVFGDDDPIDVVEIGSAALAMGSVKEVKVLGVLAMIDDGELDWKVIAVATDDALAKEYNDIDDVPESIQAGIREWFRWYKTPDDKPINAFGFDEKFLDVATTKEVIEETHEAWKKLKSGKTEAGKLWIGN
jgi:inorganic pyrophosphatase